MAQTRKRRDGVKTVASTIYLNENADKEARRRARADARSKSFILVQVLEKELTGK